MSPADLATTVDGELMVAQVEAATERGAEFLDAYVTDPMTVVDSGRILVPQDHLPVLRAAAEREGLTVQ